MRHFNRFARPTRCRRFAPLETFFVTTLVLLSAPTLRAVRKFGLFRKLVCDSATESWPQKLRNAVQKWSCMH